MDKIKEMLVYIMTECSGCKHIVSNGKKCSECVPGKSGEKRTNWEPKDDKKP